MKEPFKTYDRWVRQFYRIIDRPLPEFEIYESGPERIEILLYGLGEREVAKTMQFMLPFFLPLLKLPGVHYSVTVTTTEALHEEVHTDIGVYDE